MYGNPSFDLLLKMTYTSKIENDLPPQIHLKLGIESDLPPKNLINCCIESDLPSQICINQCIKRFIMIESDLPFKIPIFINIYLNLLLF